jgi:aminoglycoside phosphotransferase (APT) family kinase protein
VTFFHSFHFPLLEGGVMTILFENYQKPLESWLAEHWKGIDDIRVTQGLSQPEGSGYSAITMIVPVSYYRNGEERKDRIVLRVEPPEGAVYPQQVTGIDNEIEIQYKAIKAIHEHSNVPVASLIGYEENAAIIGAPFFVMEYIDGEVPIEDPIYTKEGFFVDARPEQRLQMIENGLRDLARIHAINWHDAGLDWLMDGPPETAKQLDLWERYTIRELGGRKHPDMEKAFVWLNEKLPESKSHGLCWGDARPGNMIWQNYECACVCDFENIFIGPPEIDLGWWLMFDRYAHEVQGITRLPGEPTREEQRGLYAVCTGRDIDDTYYFEVFAAVRYSALVIRVMNRLVQRGDLPEDQTLWIDNPVSHMLTAMIEGLT